MSDDALTLARELGHPFSMGQALTFAGVVRLFRREVQPTQELAEALIALCTEHGLTLYLAVGTIQRGAALTEQGREEEGIAGIREGLAAQRATGQELTRPGFLGFLAEAHGKIGQDEEGLTVLAEALALVAKTGERFYEAELYRIKGDLLLKQAAPNEDEAESCFHQAIDIAQHQSAKSWELRAATSLARLWQKQGKREEARKLLADIYGWFTEGFDTGDLKEAKALLEELGGQGTRA
jgi:predicted ATPase